MSVRRYQHQILGTIVGPIWWPVGAECTKEVCVTAEEDDTLRDVVLRVTSSGDFQHCSIADGMLRTEQTSACGRMVTTRMRYTELATFPSIQDCLTERVKR